MGRGEESEGRRRAARGEGTDPPPFIRVTHVTLTLGRTELRMSRSPWEGGAHFTYQNRTFQFSATLSVCYTSNAVWPFLRGPQKLEQK